jgi:hypothetical protein
MVHAVPATALVQQVDDFFGVCCVSALLSFL